MVQGLLTLPQELWIQILSNLDAISLIHCTMTCKSLYATFQSSSRLAYIVQLHIDGFEDVGTSIPHSQLIKHLLHHRRTWSSLKPNEELEYVILDMKHSCQAYELVGGAFANANKQHFEIVWLPTTFSNSESRTLRRASTVTPISDFAMDPTQDLMVFLEDDATPSSPTAARTVRVHIRNISTNDTHPLARQSPLQFTIPADPAHGNTIHNALLQLARNTLVLYFCIPSQFQPRVHIWDWTTSDLLVDSSTSFDPLLPLSRYDFGLLNSTYCFVTSQVGSGSIRLYEICLSLSAFGTPIHLASLHLPSTSSGTDVVAITAHTGPIEANPLPHMPFMVHDDDRLHVFKVLYHRMGRPLRGASLNVFVHQRVFTKYCTEGARRHCDGDGPLDIPWSEWGPQHTHIVSPAITQSHWQRYIHGQRVILPAHTIGNDNTTRRVYIFDFSRAAVSTAKDVDANSSATHYESNKRLMLRNTIFAWKLPFLQENVTTCLPYVSSRLSFEYAYSAFMIYGDGIVGVTTKYDDSLLLHVYPVVQEETYSATFVG